MLLAALATAERALPAYSHRYSPKEFTQQQLFACLVLKSFLKTDYRGVVAHLADCPSLLEVLKLSTVPHYTTLQKATRRLLAAAPARRLLEATIRQHMGRKRRVRRAAIDSTGLEYSATSGYFVRRRERVGMPWKTVVYHHFPKLGVVCDVEAHFILAAREDRGPKPDVADFRPLIAAAWRAWELIALWRMLDTIRRPTTRSAQGVSCPLHYAGQTRPAHQKTSPWPLSATHANALRPRRLPRPRSSRNRRLHGQTTARTLQVHSRNAWTQRRELRLKVLTHNVMILLRVEVFRMA